MRHGDKAADQWWMINQLCSVCLLRVTFNLDQVQVRIYFDLIK